MTTQRDIPGTRIGMSEASARKGWINQHRLLAYTLIAYGISWSLLIGGFFGSQAGMLNPDGQLVGLMIQIAAAGPLIAALTVIGVTRGRPGLAALGRSLVRWRVNPAWYAFVFLGVPLLMLTALAILYPGQLLVGVAERWSLFYTQWPLGVLSIAVVTGLAEEPGWRGFAQPTANRRYQPLVAALVVSLIWAAWHLPNALFGPSVIETGTHFVATVVNGFVLAWVYNATGGSVLLVMLLHGAQNATNGLVQRLFEGAADSPSRTTYYLVSALAFGVLMAIVAALTRGQLGLSHNSAHLGSSEPSTGATAGLKSAEGPRP
jgi:membrane protease YdiL (CAAX protease family)